MGIVQGVLPQQYNWLARYCIGGCVWRRRTGSCLWQLLLSASVTVTWLQHSFLTGNDHGSCCPGMVGMLVSVCDETTLELYWDANSKQQSRTCHRNGKQLNNSVALACSSNSLHVKIALLEWLPLPGRACWCGCAGTHIELQF